VRLYRPRSASLLKTFTSWLKGMPAEFSDPKFPSYGEGREGEQLLLFELLHLLLAATMLRRMTGSAWASSCGSWVQGHLLTSNAVQMLACTLLWPQVCWAIYSSAVQIKQVAVFSSLFDIDAWPCWLTYSTSMHTVTMLLLLQ
jgi:hypothetical protein